jgi:hypothetical protein
VRRNFAFFFLIFGIILFLTDCKKESVEGSYDNQVLGASAKDLLTSYRYSALQIEIQYMPGYEPDDESINSLQNFLNSRINKPGGIKVIKEQIPAGSLPVTSLNNIVSIERSWRGYFTSGNTISVYVLITNSYYSDSGILATAYWNTAFCIFGKSIDDNSGAPDQASRSVLMATLLEHEFGHLLGLVDQGSQMVTDHRDAANGAHCNNPDCLMFYNVEAGITGALTSVPLLDANCLADLKANGGK